MAKKTDPTQYLVQAYKSPYNDQLFPVEEKNAFEKHLLEEARIARDRAAAAAAKAERLQIWTTLRQSATCLKDVPTLLMNLPPELGEYYRKNAFFKDARPIHWNLSVEDKTTLAAQSITHRSALGQPTNWGGEAKDRPVYLLGLSGKSKDNLNRCFYSAQEESGISVNNENFVLFADDWPFVAKMALIAAFDKSIKAPDKFSPYHNTTGPVTATYTRFWEDIDKYSRAYAGLPYAELKGMRDMLGLGVEDLKSMMVSYEAHGHNAPVKGMQMALPDGIEDAAMPGLGV